MFSERATGVPADRPRPAQALDRLDRAAHVLPLLRLGHVDVVDPAPAVARDLPARVDHRARRLRVALERLPDGVDRQRQAVLHEDAPHAPEAGAAAELEHRLRVEVPPPHGRGRADHLVQVRLGGGVALERRVLTALLVVEDEREREPRAARPLRRRAARAP